MPVFPTPPQPHHSVKQQATADDRAVFATFSPSVSQNFPPVHFCETETRFVKPVPASCPRRFRVFSLEIVRKTVFGHPRISFTESPLIPGVVPPLHPVQPLRKHAPRWPRPGQPTDPAVPGQAGPVCGRREWPSGSQSRSTWSSTGCRPWCGGSRPGAPPPPRDGRPAHTPPWSSRIRHPRPGPAVELRDQPLSSPSSPLFPAYSLSRKPLSSDCTEHCRASRPAPARRRLRLPRPCGPGSAGATSASLIGFSRRTSSRPNAQRCSAASTVVRFFRESHRTPRA